MAGGVRIDFASNHATARRYRRLLIVEAFWHIAREAQASA